MIFADTIIFVVHFALKLGVDEHIEKVGLGTLLHFMLAGSRVVVRGRCQRNNVAETRRH